ncbi:hypothetical protein B9G55_13015 [Saccharibacillus sp. O16]|nr:hypothetical protein B9G55_13015 [Saccharibacillus sp. O16]
MFDWGEYQLKKPLHDVMKGLQSVEKPSSLTEVGFLDTLTVLIDRLQALQDQGYITWDGSRLDSIEFLRQPDQPKPSDQQAAMRYFTEC